MIIEYHPAVEGELAEIRDWYNGRVPGLGSEFIDEFERQILRISETPGRWMVLSGDIRRAIMPRFPYIICFRQVQPDRIRIVVVKHQRRHPSYGTERR